MTRLYVPTTRAGLAGFAAAGEVPAGADRFAAAADADEEGEYLALMSAADACPEPALRVVVVAEVGDGSDVDGALPWRRVVAVHADPEPRGDAADPDDDLAWFAVQEVGELAP